MLVPLEAIEAARERLRPHLRPTPIQRLDSYSGRLDAEVWGKLELLQPTRAFKVRGALNALLALAPEQRERGVVAASAGNHGLGLAFAAARADTRATVVLPETAPPVRAEAIRALGGEAILEGEDWNAANRAALNIAEREGRVVIPPFDHPDIMAGQGTIALELLEQLPDVDVIVCSVGGGGLISGIASAVRHLRPDVKVIGVETEGADCMARSLRAGEVVELDRFGSIATSLGTRRTGERQLAIVREAVEQVTVVSDRAALRELVACLNDEKLFLEPAASCTLAALADPAMRDLDGAVVAPILCGANVTLGQLAAWAETFGLAQEFGLRLAR